MDFARQHFFSAANKSKVGGFIVSFAFAAFSLPNTFIAFHAFHRPFFADNWGGLHGFC
jgi:hypothetical protein